MRMQHHYGSVLGQKYMLQAQSVLMYEERRGMGLRAGPGWRAAAPATPSWVAATASGVLAIGVQVFLQSVFR